MSRCLCTMHQVLANAHDSDCGKVKRPDGVRVAYPLFQGEGGGSSPTSGLHARDLQFSSCPKQHAVQLVRKWHSRLPRVQRGPWMYAFDASCNGVTYVVALWCNPSARTLPQQQVELRRMACAPDAPKNTASRFLMWMIRWFRANHPEHERAISYQDTAVHKGTIYKASGWEQAFVSKPRIRCRFKPRKGTNRPYRSDMNGLDVYSAAKIRWEISLNGHKTQ